MSYIIYVRFYFFCLYLYHMKSHFVIVKKVYKKKSESKSISQGESIISVYNYDVSTYNLTGMII